LANPFFDWTASLSRFIDFDVPTAADLNAPLDQVTTGFDAVEVRIDAIDADLAGLSSPVQTQLDAKADITGETYTGAHNFTGATLTAATATAGDATTKVATTAFVDAAVVAAATGITVASQAEMEAGTEAGQRIVSPLRVAQAIAAQTDLPYEARATNTVFAAADDGKFIEYTASFTQTFGAAAALGAGWWCVLKNAFTDSVYLTPSGGATIDGVADFLMYPGEARLLQCDGTNFHSVVLQPFQAAYTSSGFFFKPPGYKYFSGLMWGGGGAGGTNAAATGGGGGGGACTPFNMPAAALGASETITIGAAAAGRSTSGAGAAGSNSTFGSLLTAYGGAGGLAANGGGGGGLHAAGSNSAGGAPLGGAGGGAATFGGGGGASSTGAGGAAVYGGGGGGDGTGAGGRSSYGGGGGGGYSNAAGGVSTFGGAGGPGVSTGGAGADGVAPGGGGGGCATGTSGAGARGELRIWGVV
jgi:hypothetical protein